MPELSPSDQALGDDLLRALWWKVAGEERLRSAELVIPRVKQNPIASAAFLLHLTYAALGAYAREVGRPQHHLMAEIWKVPNA